MTATLDKVVHLSADRAERLERLANERQTTEDELVEKALDLLFSFAGERNIAEENSLWSLLSRTSLDRVWDNEADTVYDNWKELYGIPEK